MDITKIKYLCENGKMRWSNHILIRLSKRNISMDAIECAIINGEIIELYPNDYPYPSCLILGLSIDKKYLHVVCGVDQTELHLITAYYPNPDEWSNNFRIRKENK